jgi:hypothetical protein
MFPNWRSARMLAACVVITFSAPAVQAHVLVEHQGTSFRTQSETFAPLANVAIGSADVRISGFGVYGQTSVPTNLIWVVFDADAPETPAFISAIHSIDEAPGSFAVNARWYDSPQIDITLQAKHRYAIGVLADRLGPAGFRWGMGITQKRYGGGGPAIDGNGLSLSFSAALANAGLAGSFHSSPSVYAFDRADPLEWNNALQPSLRIVSPVAEPREWMMLLSGLSLVGLIRRRQLRVKGQLASSKPGQT